MPGTAASSGRSSWMISSAECFRSARGFSMMPSRPMFCVSPMPPAVRLDMNVSISGCFRMMAATCCWCSTMLSKEVSWAASVMPMICPVSSVGMNPLGTTKKRMAVPMRRRADTTMTAGRCARHRSRVQR